MLRFKRMIERPRRAGFDEHHSLELGKRHSLRFRIVSSVAGISIGAICLWLVLRGVDARDLQDAMRDARHGYLLIALAAYWVATGIRIVRWHMLLAVLARIRLRQIGESALIGYAASIVMPARLGEPLRAEYTQRRFKVDRFAVFGSIITERLIDAVAVVILLIAGLALSAADIVSGEMYRLGAVVTVASGIIIATIAGLAAVYIITHSTERLPGWADGALKRLLYGVGTLNRENLSGVTTLTLLIWIFEIAALLSIFRGLDTNLDIGHVCVLTGVATLSTLVPAAPGYVGSLQLVFGYGMTTMGLPAATGVLAATLVQLLFYGSLVIVATLVAACRR